MNLSVILISILSLVLNVKPPGETVKLWSDNDDMKGKTKLYVSHPTADKHNGSAIIICPGGSYHHLGLKHEGHQVAEWFNELGFTSFVLRYRVGFYGWSHPAMIQDAQKAILWVRNNAEYYNIFPEKVGIIGFSAGGHLAASTAILSDSNFISHTSQKDNLLKPDFAVLMYPVISLTDSIGHKRSIRNLLGKNYTPETKKMLSLEFNDSKSTPPILTIHAIDDKVVNYKNSLYFYKKIENKNSANKLILYENGGHGFGVKDKPIVEKWKQDCLNWLIDNKLY